MGVTVLFFDGCPSYEALMPRLRTLVLEAGLTEDDIALQRVESPGEAEAQRFLGSPTVRVDGVDVEPGAADREDFGMKCRLYRFAECQTPTPPDAWIRSALKAATVR